MKSYNSIIVVILSTMIYGCGSMPAPNNFTQNKKTKQQSQLSKNVDRTKSTKLSSKERSKQNLNQNSPARTSSSDTSTGVVVNNIEKQRHSRILAAINTTGKLKNRTKTANSSKNKKQSSSSPKKAAVVVAKKKAVAVPKKSKKVRKAKVSTPQPRFDEDVVKYNLANRYYRSGKYQNSIDVLESSRHDTSKNVRIRDLLVLAYTAYARELVSKAEMLEAQTILEKALTMQPKNKTIRRQLKSVKNVREANTIYKKAVNAYNDGKNKLAFKSFARVLSLNPAHKKAKSYHAKIKAVVVDTYHKKALQFYRRQKLSKAIAEWNRLLKVDPSNDLARIYRSRAIELQKKFEKL